MKKQYVIVKDGKLVNTELEKWREDGTKLKDQMIEYNWTYRKKICTKCPIETQKKLNCLRVNKFRNELQETHCDKLVKSRTSYFRKKISMFFSMKPLESAKESL